MRLATSFNKRCYCLASLFVSWTTSCLAQQDECLQNNAGGDFVAEPLKVGEVAPIRWKDTGEIVHEYVFEVGIGDEMRRKLLDYSTHKGITQVLENCTAGGHALEPDDRIEVYIGEYEAYALQRPSKNWNSDLHWLSLSLDDDLTEEWLEALSAAGFDEVLNGIGESLHMDGLFAFSTTFIAASFGGKGYLHEDVANTDGKSYNIIIPLLSTAGESEPQLLDIQDSTRKVEGSDEFMVGRYQYRPDVAVLIGDGVKHATSALEYRASNGFRMAATILMTDANINNVDRVAENDSGHYVSIDKDWILENAGSHWTAGDPSKRLPEPNEDHFLVRTLSSS